MHATAAAPIAEIEGLLFDTAYLAPSTIHLWVWAASGRQYHLTTPYLPPLYLAGPWPVADRAAHRLAASGTASVGAWTERIEFWSGRTIRVRACRVRNPRAVVQAVRALLHSEHRLRAYDVDIDPVLHFHSTHRLHPLARVAVVHQGGQLVSITALDRPATPHWRLPPLRKMTLRLADSGLIPLERGNRIVATMEGRDVEIDGTQPKGGLQALAALLRQGNPDLILSADGDEVLLPWLWEQAKANEVALPLDRQAPPVVRRRGKGRSIGVYSGILYQAPDAPLLGRWHIDGRNSFFLSHTEFEGVVEVARLSRYPVQKQARRSGGAAITGSKIHCALEGGILVPFIKAQTEAPRPASELLRADRGGLTYFPRPGLYEDVIELDYVQQYPSLMDTRNISPETVDCGCCKGEQPVPNTAHHICRRRRGLVPRALRPYLAQRNAYKKLAATADVAERKRYEARRTALKWVLVTTFGYQGFENATFGHIAAHEAITAWGREILLQAKEAAEARGFEMLHALTDSLYVHRHGATMAEADALASAVTARTGITLAVEGRFDWIVFPPARSRPASGVATRYFGRYEDGSLKLRGIRVRQHGPPPIVAQAQAAFLSIMQGCRSRQELNACRSQLREELSRWHARLHSGAVPCSDLLVRARVSREADQYKARTAVAECLRKLLAHGISIPAGRTVEYLIVDRSHPDPSERYLPVPMVPVSHHYDVQAYRALLEDAFMEVTACLDAPISLVRGYAQLPLWSAGHVRTIYGEADVVGGLSTGLVPRA